MASQPLHDLQRKDEIGGCAAKYLAEAGSLCVIAWGHGRADGFDMFRHGACDRGTKAPRLGGHQGLGLRRCGGCGSILLRLPAFEENVLADRMQESHNGMDTLIASEVGSFESLMGRPWE